jgi:endonuclease-3 related protein
MAKMLQQVYRRLLAALGPQQWWPADSPFEVMVGAVLTQNTSWKNVERAIDNLRDVDALTIVAIEQMTDEELAETIRPAGYYRVKARRLKNLVAMIVDQHHGSLDSLFGQSTDSLREQLLTVNGIGPETADSIVLYAAEKPSFVVDAYTARILKRHGWIEPEADYYGMQQRFLDDLPRDDTELFKEYHALIVVVGKQFCKPKPQCDRCPLADMLPEGGIVEL